MNTFPQNPSRAPSIKIAAAFALAASLQGCVAIAIPAIAGGVIAREEIERGAPEQRPADEAVKTDAAASMILPSETTIVAPPDDELEAQEFEIASEMAVAAFERRDIQNGEVARQTPQTPRSPQSLAELASTDLAEQFGRPEPIYTSGFHALASYTLGAIGEEAKAEPTPSALLTNPSQLDGERRMCSAGKPAILIDLDEQGRAFDPATLAPTYDGDSFGHLSRLRDAGVTIGWSSALAAERAGEVRKALRRSGLDVAGQDALVLLRYPKDRKQTRRAEFGTEHCLIAIAGDERMDFDELYEYLVAPDAAIALEPLIGNGWFLLENGLPAKSEKP